MPFMRPEILTCDYWLIDTDQGGQIIPCDVCDPDDRIGPDDTHAKDESDDERIDRLEDEFRDYMEGHRLITAERCHGVIGRLSASGYLDCTDWSAYDSEEAAIAELVEDDQEAE